MKTNEPFTSDHARVPDAPDALTQRQIDTQIKAISAAVHACFGSTGEAQYKKYFGLKGEFRVGWRSEYGFHVRGRGPSAADALGSAQKSRLPDDPPFNPHYPPRSSAAKILCVSVPSANSVVN